MTNSTSQRSTKQRQEVFDAVNLRCDHPTADEIFADVKKIDSKISRATVYRDLKQLAEDGKITHVKVPGADRYDLRTDKHYHVKCTVCGKVIDIKMDYFENFDSSVANETGFIINRHQAVFEGICPNCQKKGK